MVGLGCGAALLHPHGSPCGAVCRARPRRAGDHCRLCRASAAAFACADHGFHLNGDEQRRRHTLQTLLQCDGLALGAYRRRFGTDALADLPQLRGT